MRSHDIISFLDKGELPFGHVRYSSDSSAPWPFTVLINNSNQDYPGPRITIHMNEVQLIHLINTLTSAYKTILRNRRGL